MNVFSTLSCTVIGVIIYFGLKPYIFSRIKISKWLVLLLMVLTSVISAFIPVNTWILHILLTIYVVFILWFVDIHMSIKKKTSKIVKKGK